MGENHEFTVELKQRQHDYLTEIATKYHLPDVSKALRCLVNHAMENQAQEATIFNDIRCLDCS